MWGNFGYFVVLARNCLAFTLSYIVMQMKKANREMGCSPSLQQSKMAAKHSTNDQNRLNCKLDLPSFILSMLKIQWSRAEKSSAPSPLPPLAPPSQAINNDLIDLLTFRHLPLVTCYPVSVPTSVYDFTPRASTSFIASLVSPNLSLSERKNVISMREFWLRASLQVWKNGGILVRFAFLERGEVWLKGRFVCPFNVSNQNYLVSSLQNL